MKKITMIVAMKQEAAPLIEHLSLTETNVINDVIPCKAYTGMYGHLDISLIINGTDKTHEVENVGTQPATLAAYEAIRVFNPDLLINAGTCGAYAIKGSRIGDVYIGERIRFFDRRIPLGKPYEEYGLGNYHCDKAIEVARQLKLPTSVVCTGNSLDISPTDEAILREEPLVNKEMEAAAIAWVAAMYAKPLIAVKSVTDLIDSHHTTAEEFGTNLALASSNLQKEVVRLLDFLSSQLDTAA